MVGGGPLRSFRRQ